MRYCAWNSRMNVPMKTGGTMRDNLEQAAERGNPVAIRLLRAPRQSIALEYLWSWFLEIRVGAGQSLSGIAPLTWTEVDAWARCAKTRPYPHEIKALFSLDIVARDPESFEKEDQKHGSGSRNTRHSRRR
jgi:hypothetical protein